MPQFEATIKHIKEGVKSFTIAAAVKNIDGWGTTLEKSEVAGVKTVMKDLKTLKEHLQAKDIDAEGIKKLVLKLGHETVKIAGKADQKTAEKIRALGEALTHAAEQAT